MIDWEMLPWQILIGIAFIFIIYWVVFVEGKWYDEMIEEGVRAIGRRHREREVKRTQKQIFDKEFLAIRTAVLKRDNYKCVNCNMTGKELHVHHIVPRSEGGTNDLFNLVTLCDDCHGEQDAKGHDLIGG